MYNYVQKYKYLQVCTSIYKYVHNKDKKWLHILIDLSPANTIETEIRSNILADNRNHNYEICYKFIK